MQSKSRLSPYRSNPRPDINVELNDHSNRIRELLRADLTMLQEQNSILKLKCKQLGELEEKIEIIAKHNAQLLNENENLSKQSNQRKADYEILKNKFDSQIHQKLGESVTRQFQIKKLLSQIEHLTNDLQQMQTIKNQQINDLKNHYQAEIQNIKKNSLNTNEMYQLEMRKIRQVMDKKEFQINQYAAQAKRRTSQAQYEVLKLKDQRQKLKKMLESLQWDKKNQMETLKYRLQANFNQEIEKLRRNNFHSIDSIEMERQKLKDIIEVKNIEIQQLNNKLVKQKSQFDQTTTILKKQNENTKVRLAEVEKLNQIQFQSLKKKLGQVHQNQILQVKLSNNKYLQCLQNQISKLEDINKNKNSQIQQIIRQKTSVRQAFENQRARFETEILQVNKKLKQQQNNYQSLVKTYEQKINQKEKQIQYLQNLNAEQFATASKQQQMIKKLYQRTKNQMESNAANSREQQQGLKRSLNEAKIENEDLKQKIRKESIEKQRLINDIKSSLQSQVSLYKTKLQTSNSNFLIAQNQCQSLKQTLHLKQQQIKLLQNKVLSAAEREKKLDKQNEDLKNKLNKKDKNANQMLTDQRNRLESSFAYTLQSLKNDHHARLSLEINKQNDLIKKFNQKEKEVNDLMKAYKKMTNEIQSLTLQESNKKQLTIKYPGATSDLIATKNLFDVYLKTKVLDYCGDALSQKQNLNKQAK